MGISTENLGLNVPDDITFFQRFGTEHDRFAFPGPIYRVSGGHGGEAILIVGPEKTMLLDCGMAYCGPVTVDNAKKVLEHLGRDLDYILLSHSHYDHMGALPFFREAFPEVEVLGSEHCAAVLERENARKLIKELGENARNRYEPESRLEISTEGLRVDRILKDGEIISLGAEGGSELSGKILYTPGHTDCSISLYLLPLELLFTSESTGILEGEDYLHTPCLKSFIQGLESIEKCEKTGARHVCLPHYGMLPDDFVPRFWGMFPEECRSKACFVMDMKERGLTEEEMLEKYLERYWTPAKETEQPREAFVLNSGYILKTLLRELDELKEHFERDGE